MAFLSSRKGVLFRLNSRNEEISLAEERGVRTYKATHDLALRLQNNKIVVGEYVKLFFDHPEKKVSRVVPQTCSGKLDKWSEKYAFISCLSPVPVMKTKKRRVTDFTLKVSSENIFIESDETSTVDAFEPNSIVNFNAVVSLSSMKSPCTLTAKNITLSAAKASSKSENKSPAKIESWFSRRMSTPVKMKEGAPPASASRRPHRKSKSKRWRRKQQQGERDKTASSVNQELAEENKLLKQQLEQILSQQQQPSPVSPRTTGGHSLPPIEHDFDEFQGDFGRPTSTRSDWGAAGPPMFDDFERVEPYRRYIHRPLSNPFPSFVHQHSPPSTRGGYRYRQRSAPMELYSQDLSHEELEFLEMQQQTYI